MIEGRDVSTYTLEMLLEVYEREYVPLKAQTTQNQLRWFLGRLRRDFGPLSLGEVTPALLQAWRDRLRQTRKPGTVRQYLEMLSALLTVAVEDLEWLPANPLRKVRRPRQSPDRVRYLDADEQQRLLAACRASTNPFLYALVLLAMTTGLRRGELFGLRWSQVDVERGCVRLPQTKNGLRRAVPMPAVAREALLVCRGDTETGAWVFPHKHKRTKFPYEGDWYKVLRQSEVVDFRFHDLRHTAASYLFLSGADIKEVQEILGHKSLRMTLKYVHLSLPHTRGVVERMALEMIRVE